MTMISEDHLLPSVEHHHLPILVRQVVADLEEAAMVSVGLDLEMVLEDLEAVHHLVPEVEDHHLPMALQTRAPEDLEVVMEEHPDLARATVDWEDQEVAVPQVRMDLPV
uniref:Uncharacterized protein n=1 Tax=Cacopsylla melanoneura TaxID=428564 RepID=A0A8D8Z143_9HEMI